MTSEFEKMLGGDLYDASDPDLSRARERGHALCQRYNATRDDEAETRRRLLAELIGQPSDAWIQPPFQCDYGTNLVLGRRVFFNFNCVVLDCATVRIGDNVMIAPCVQLYTAGHPLDAATRRAGLEWAKPITIGADVWIGGGAIVCPGVTIGARSVIGAGSVVTRDIPADVVAAGNPARIIRRLDRGQEG